VQAVSYMGTKRHLAPAVGELVADSPPGTFLDLFSGMCSVGQSVAPSRHVWSNDLQHFAHLVAKCQFCNILPPRSRCEADTSLFHLYRSHLEELEAEYRSGVEAEKAAIAAGDIGWISKQFEDGIFRANRLSHGDGARYRLFTDRFAGTYFGLRQCIEIDAIRRAIDLCGLSDSDREWCIVALCGALSRSANTTGHFAQALNPKAANQKKVLHQRQRSLWGEFLAAIERLEPIGSAQWRAHNRSFQLDAISLLERLPISGELSVVYADPPYTEDQYSRYYHLYETLVLYDYPAARGRGLYRDGRAVSLFSHASKARSAMDKLIACTARIGAELILSYPADGLLENSKAQISDMIVRHYGRAPDIFPVVHRHSTMGASKGDAKRQVTELLYRARR